MAVKRADCLKLSATTCYIDYIYLITKERTKGYVLLYLAEILNIEEF